MQETETTQSRSQARRIAAQRGEEAPTFTPESSAATMPESPEEVAAQEQIREEKQKYGSYPSMNRHERRKAAKLNRQERKRH